SRPSSSTATPSVDSVDLGDDFPEPPAIDDRERLAAAGKKLLGKLGQTVDQLLGFLPRVVAGIDRLKHELERTSQLVNAPRFVSPLRAAQNGYGFIPRHTASF